MASFWFLATLSLLLALPHAALAQQGKASPSPSTKSAPSPAPAAGAASYEVARGDTLFRIAGKVRPQGVTLHQMVLALFKANPDAFLDGNINQLVVGRTMSVPPLEAITSVDAAKAAEEVRGLTAKPASAPPAPAAPQPKEPAAPSKPRPDPAPAKTSVPPPVLSREQAAERFKEALEQERRGDLAAAMKLYVAAGDSGNGEAQKRLGDIYNTGNALVRRDYETALKWYQKARAQGVEIPKPIVAPGPRY